MKYWIPHGPNIYWQGLIPVAKSLAYKNGGEVCLDAAMPAEACVVIGRHLLDKLPPSGSVLVNTEYNLNQQGISGYEEWDILDENEGKHGKIVRMGWYPTDDPVVVPEPCDVLFAGWMHERRSKVLEAIGEKGYKIIWARDHFENDLLPYTMGAKIILDIHYHIPKARFNPLRVIPNMMRGKAVVSESAGGYYGHRLAGGYMPAEHGDIVDEVVRLLEDDEERLSLGRRAQEKVRGL